MKFVVQRSSRIWNFYNARIHTTRNILRTHYYFCYFVKICNDEISF